MEDKIVLNCFNCRKSHSLYGYEGSFCKDDNTCNRASLWEPRRECRLCQFREYKNSKGFCSFKEDKSADYIEVNNRKIYRSSNKYPSKKELNSGSYCDETNNHWAWKLDQTVLDNITAD